MFWFRDRGGGPLYISMSNNNSNLEAYLWGHGVLAEEYHGG